MTLALVGKVDKLEVEPRPAEIIAADQFDPDSSPNNEQPAEDDQATVTLTPQSADLTVTKTVDNAKPDVGDQVTFTLSVSNAGPDTATNVTLHDVLSAGLTFVSATPSQGTYTPASGTWSAGSVPANSAVTLRLVAIPTSVGDKTNVAEVTKVDQFDPDSTPGNNVASEDDQGLATVQPLAADLSLAMAVDAVKPNVGSEATFKLTLTNDGPDSASGVVVLNSLPKGLTFVRATPSQGSFNSVTGLWTIGSVSANAGATLEIVAHVDTYGEKITSAQVVKVDQGDADSIPANDNAAEDDQASVVVTPQLADLALQGEVDNAAPNVGDTITFKVTLTNDGPDAATGVLVTDLLPDGLEFVSANPSQGLYSEGNGVWAIGTIGVTARATLEIVATVAGPEIVSNIAQVTTADQADPDSQPGNGVATEDDQATVEIVPQVIDLAVEKKSDPNPGDRRPQPDLHDHCPQHGPLDRHQRAV